MAMPKQMTAARRKSSFIERLLLVRFLGQALVYRKTGKKSIFLQKAGTENPYRLFPNEDILPEFPLPFEKDAEILVYCRSGRRSAEAAEKLADMGYENVGLSIQVLKGDGRRWIAVRLHMNITKRTTTAPRP